MITCKVVVLRNKPIAFLATWLPSPSSLLKLPNDEWCRNAECGKREVEKMRSLYFCGKCKIEGKTQLNFFFTMEPIARKLCMKLP